MSDKTRLITLGVIVFIFIVGNVIAGYYKWGASRETPNRQVQLKDAAEDIGDQKKQKNESTNESDALKGPAAAPVEQTTSGETDAKPVNADIQAQIASLKEENAVLLSRQRTDNDLAAENLKLKEQLQAALQANKTLEKETNALRSTENKNREIATGQSELQEQIVSYKKEITSLRNELRNKQNLENQNRQLSEKVQDYSETSIDLEKRISELQDQVDQYQNLVAENQRLQAKLEASTKENEALKARLDKIRKMVAVEEKSDQ